MNISKYIFRTLIALVIIWPSAHSAQAAGDNLIPNPSVENGATSPMSWDAGSWGTNNAVFDYLTNGYNSSRSLKVTVSGYVDGDAKWFFAPVNIEPGQTYNYSDYYRSSSISQIVAEYSDINGNRSYAWLGETPVSSVWKNYSVAFKVPAGIQSVSIFHLLDTNGWLQTDVFSLTKEGTVTITDNVPNGDLEEQSAAGQPLGWQQNSWGTNSASFSYIAPGYASDHAVRTEISSYTDGDAKWYYTPQPVKPNTRYKYQDFYRSSVPTQLVAMVEKGTVTNPIITYAYLGEVPASADWSPATAYFVTPSTTAALRVSVFHILGSVGWLEIDKVGFPISPPAGFKRGLVTLSFDDGWSTVATNAQPIFRQYNVKTSLFLLTGSLNAPGYMTDAQVRSLQAYGHEIASHSVTHPHMTQLSTFDQVMELEKSQTDLQNKFGVPVRNFATPYGEYNTALLDLIKTRYDSHRTVNEGYNSKDSFDPYQVVVQNVLGSTTLQQMQAWTSYAQANRLWLVLVYHQVSSNVKVAGTYNTTPTQLRNQLGIITKSGLTVLPYGQALAEVESQP